MEFYRLGKKKNNKWWKTNKKKYKLITKTNKGSYRRIDKRLYNRVLWEYIWYWRGSEGRTRTSKYMRYDNVKYRIGLFISPIIFL